MDFLIDFGYVGLFIAAFLAATILPLGSEVILVSLLISGLSPIALVVVSSAGNVLGSYTNYLIGAYLSQGKAQRWLKVSDQELEQAQQRFKKYGTVSLCFAWLPVIGDPLTLIAGILRVNLVHFFSLVTIGKAGRYAVLAYFTLLSI
ncbi:YqaA family protein [Parashewanella tropica]|uniref:YqaA family protein n=1 Tax=Parashewanella tropica TaxID=2547970 RepID=UPI00105A75BF|nr:YqaA family protein [Parashewanella tropica]